MGQFSLAPKVWTYQFPVGIFSAWSITRKSTGPHPMRTTRTAPMIDRAISQDSLTECEDDVNELPIEEHDTGI
jgi:hypothetical protein